MMRVVMMKGERGSVSGVGGSGLDNYNRGWVLEPL